MPAVVNSCASACLIRHSHAASLDFTWLGRTYTFKVPAWKSGGIDKFVKLFQEYEPRDAEEFGRRELGSDGKWVPVMNNIQKENAVLRGCQDIMACLHKILDKYQSSVMDYAFWYRENYPGDKDYSSYIALRTCHCIVHSQFFSSQNSRDIVKF